MRCILAGAALAACADDDPTTASQTADTATASHPHCGGQIHLDPRDAMDLGGFETVVVDAGDPDDPSDDRLDVRMPALMVDWLDEQRWPVQHDNWHVIRRVDQSCRESNPTEEGCEYYADLVGRGLWRADEQEQSPGDGYAFLVMHRHMLEGLRAAFPSHPELTRSFDHVPLTLDDPENLTPWRAPVWSDAQREAIAVMEDIESHVDEFETEDDFGIWLQAPFVWTDESPSVFVDDPTTGIHFALHAQWSVFGSPAELGNGVFVILNPYFWRLHGWIDDAWERFRIAKGLDGPSDVYDAEYEAQCEEMTRLSPEVE